MLRRLVQLLVALLLATYPLFVYFGIQRWGVRSVAVGLAVIFLVRILAIRSGAGTHWLRPALLASGMALVPTALAAWLESETALRLNPVIINSALLLAFGWTLRNPPTMIERFARLQDPNLPASGIWYTGRLTRIWMAFFLCNGAIALYTALWTDLETWTLYNGGIAYGLIGLLAGGELLVRPFAKRHLARRFGEADA